ncbi:MAG TPA: hypothetical protein VK489_11755 [Ferruginibacter sp.]|nr:hypothetical protein [Ferruginibacter sp.]
MKKLLLSALFAATVFSIFSCKKNTEIAAPESTAPRYVTGLQNKPYEANVTGREGDCLATEVNLMAGQTMVAGTVSVTNDAENIYVTYNTTGGWVLTATHLYVGDCALIPVNNPGNPIPGQFPYKGTHTNLTSVTYTVPISQIPAGTCACIAAHGVVKELNSSGGTIQTQTGWGQGVQINMGSGNWGMKFDYCSCPGL